MVGGSIVFSDVRAAVPIDSWIRRWYVHQIFQEL